MEENTFMSKSNYPSEPIGDGNPYHRCVHCKRSAPEINGGSGEPL